MRASSALLPSTVTCRIKQHVYTRILTKDCSQLVFRIKQLSFSHLTATRHVPSSPTTAFFPVKRLSNLTMQRHYSHHLFVFKGRWEKVLFFFIEVLAFVDCRCGLVHQDAQRLHSFLVVISSVNWPSDLTAFGCHFYFESVAINYSKVGFLSAFR